MSCIHCSRRPSDGRGLALFAAVAATIGLLFVLIVTAPDRAHSAELGLREFSGTASAVLESQDLEAGITADVPEVADPVPLSAVPDAQDPRWTMPADPRPVFQWPVYRVLSKMTIVTVDSSTPYGQRLIDEIEAGGEVVDQLADLYRLQIVDTRGQPTAIRLDGKAVAIQPQCELAVCDLHRALTWQYDLQNPDLVIHKQAAKQEPLNEPIR